MAIQFSTAVRNAREDAIEAAIGTSPKLAIYSGAMPATVATARSGTLLATLTLPADWLANAANGAKALSGTWAGTASAAGTAGYYTIFASDGVTPHVQGTITITGSGGDMTLDNTNIASGQSISVNAFSFTDANA